MTLIGLTALSHEGLSLLGRVRAGEGATEVNGVDARPSERQMHAATDHVDAATGRE
jgi:hypothetical protein